MRKMWLAILVAHAFTGMGCFETPSREKLEQKFDNYPDVRVIARYDPLAGILPYPSNLVFSGTEDGTMNIPVDDPSDYAVPQVVLNSLDGFSTQQPMTFVFDGLIDETTVVAGDTVRVFEVNLYSFFLYATDVVRELTPPNAQFGVVGDYTTSVFTSLDPGPDEVMGTADDVVTDGVMISPTVPLTRETAYVTIVTNGITDRGGKAVAYDLIYGVSKGTVPLLDVDGHTVVEYTPIGDAEAQALEPLRQINSSFEAAVAPYGIKPADIVMSFAFTTQSTTTMINAIASGLEAGEVKMGPLIDATGARLDDSLTGIGTGAADIYLGTIDVPYYLDGNSAACHFENITNNAESACPAITSKWMGYQNNFPTRFYHLASGYGPQQNGTETVPFFVTVPNASSGCTKPADGWPVNMFVHTMTQARWNIFAVSSIMADACVAGFAMDLPLHGINKEDASAGEAGCEGAVNALYAFSADAPAAFDNKACTCTVVDGEAEYTMADSAGIGVYQALPWFSDVSGTMRERTLGVDRNENFPGEAGSAGPDGQVDSSGTHFFNPAAMLTTRDNMRQGAVDIATAAKAIPTIRDTWTGTLHGQQVQLSTTGLIPDGCMPAGASSPSCGPMFEVGAQALFTYDPDDSLHAILGPWESPVDLMLASLTSAGGSAATIVSGMELTDTGSVVPTSGTLYELMQAMTISSQVSEAYLGSCGTSNAATITATVVGTMDLISGQGANLSPSGAWSLGIPGAVDPYTVPYITADDVAAALGEPSTGAEALQAASDNAAAALASAIVAISDGSIAADAAQSADHADDVPGQLGNYVDTFVNDASEDADFVESVTQLKDGIDALQALGGISTDCSDGAPACLGDNTGNISAGTRAGLLNAYLVAAAGQAQAQTILDLGSTVWDGMLANASVQLDDVSSAAATVGLASDAANAAVATYAASGADVQAGMEAFLLSGCTDAVALAPLGTAQVNAMAMLESIGGVALSVSALADEIVNQADVTDAGTLMGPTATLLGAAGGAIASLTALSGATGHITTALSAWESGTLFDGSRIALTGHGVGAAIGFVAATMEPSISHLALLAPSGSLAYSLENSDTVGPLLRDGLKAAAGIEPGTALWDSFFSVLQAALDPIDPLNYLADLDEHQAVLMVEMEDDDFFPASVAERPLAGTSVFASHLGLARIAETTQGGAGVPLRAATRLNSEASWAGHATYLDPTAGCVSNACGDAELDLACLAANDEIRREAWGQVLSFINARGTGVTVNAAGAATGNALVDHVD